MQFDTFNHAIEGGIICHDAMAAILSDNGAGDTLADLYRSIYRYTACGPSLSVKLHDGRIFHNRDLDAVKTGDVRALRITSIIEGSDSVIESDWIDLLIEPNPVAAFNAAINWVDSEVASHVD